MDAGPETSYHGALRTHSRKAWSGGEPIGLGRWERAFLAKELEGDVVVGWVGRLDGPLDAERLRVAVRRAAKRFPVISCRVDVGERGRLEAIPVEGAPEFIVHPADMTVQALQEIVLRRPLVSVDGCFSIHVVPGAQALVGIRMSHVAGDAWTFAAIRDFISAVYQGQQTPEAALPVEGHAFDPRSVRNHLSLKPQPRLAALRYGRLRQPTLSYPTSGPDEGEGAGWRLRLCRLTLGGRLANDVQRLCLSLRVAPTVHLLASAAIAIDRHCPDWYQEPGDHWAINVPRNVRLMLGWGEHPGNLVMPFSVPLLREDLLGHREACAAIRAHLVCGLNSYLYYHHALRWLDGLPAPGLRSKSCTAGVTPTSARLSPLLELGATVLSQDQTALGFAGRRTLRSWFASPLIVRSWDGGRPVVSLPLRWHPAVAEPLQALVQTFCRVYLTGSESTAVQPELEWV